MKIFRIIGLLAAVVLIVLIGAFVYVKMALPSVPEAPDIAVELSTERIKRGAFLANNLMGCMDCHAQRDFSKYTAPVIPGTQGAGGEKWGHEMGFEGELYAPNITPYALKNWTDGEIYRAITMGVSKNGEALFPIMPYLQYGKLADEDIYDLIAYLRTVPEVENTVPIRELDFPLNLIVNTIPKETKDKMPHPDHANKLAYGKYLVIAGACTECHTRQEKGEFIEEEYLGGGFEFKMPNGTMVTSSNITPHKEYGIGAWSMDKFVEAFHQYRDTTLAQTKVKEGQYNTIMPWTYYCKLNRPELEAMYTYLQSVEPVGNKVEKFKVLAAK